MKISLNLYNYAIHIDGNIIKEFIYVCIHKHLSIKVLCGYEQFLPSNRKLLITQL